MREVRVRDVEHPPRGAEREPGVVGDLRLAVVAADDELLALPPVHIAALGLAGQLPLGGGDELGGPAVDRCPLVPGREQRREGELGVPLRVEVVNDRALDVVELGRRAGEVPAGGAVREEAVVELVRAPDPSALEGRGVMAYSCRELRPLAMHAATLAERRTGDPGRR